MTWEETWDMLFPRVQRPSHYKSTAISPLLLQSEEPNVRSRDRHKQCTLVLTFLTIFLGTKHTDRKMENGNSMVGFMQRNLRVSNKDAKATAYFILVQPNVVYCASMWSPYTDQGKRKVETQEGRSFFLHT